MGVHPRDLSGAGLVVKFAQLLPHLDERRRRLYLASEAIAIGHGGIAAVAAASGAGAATVARGIAELAANPAPTERIRAPGAGRKPLSVTDADLVPALEALIEPRTRIACSPRSWAAGKPTHATWPWLTRSAGNREHFRRTENPTARPAGSAALEITRVGPARNLGTPVLPLHDQPATRRRRRHVHQRALTAANSAGVTAVFAAVSANAPSVSGGAPTAS